MDAAPLHEFSHLFGVSFEANLAYSLIIEFGRNGMAAIDDWTDEQMLRVIPPLCENSNVDVKKLETNITAVRFDYRKHIGLLNQVCIVWAAVATIADILLLALAAYHFEISVPFDCWFVTLFTFLFGPVFFGFLLAMLCRVYARYRMKQHTKFYDELIKIAEQAPAAKVEDARKALKQQLNENRRNGEKGL